MAKVAENLAANIRQLRDGRGLSQQQLAEMSGVPRATWANLESGEANPTLSVLLRVATTLQVTLEELVGPPRATARLYRAGSLPSRRRGQASIRNVLPDPMSGLQIERIELPAGSGFTGVPHTPGTREYLACEQGSMELSASGETWRLEPGDVVVFRGDQRHAYRNPGRGRSVAYSVIALAPVASD